MSDILSLATENEALTTRLRREIHRNPELSGVEYQTLAYIREKLTEYDIAFEEIENGGILGYIGGDGSKKTVLLRADVDALPITENPRNLTREREVISENPGAAHMCGHDAHTAILLTAGKILKQRESTLRGNRVILLFERGEEGTGNLRYVLNELINRGERIDAAHAIHVRPDIPTGTLFTRPGDFMAGASGFKVTIHGQGGHGSRPDRSSSPIDSFAAVYSALGALRVRYISPFESVSFSVGSLHSGSKGNVIPGELTFEGSVRFFDTDVFTKFAAEFRNILDNITAAYHNTYTLTGLSSGGLPLSNNIAAATFARDTIAKHLGAGANIDAEPAMGSESFSLVAALYPTVMLNLGVYNESVGSGADWHSEYFDLDEAALKYGVAETVAFATEFLGTDTAFTPDKPVDYEAIKARLVSFP
jgi:amidohydrolase